MGYQNSFEQSVNKQPGKEGDDNRHRPFLFAGQSQYKIIETELIEKPNSQMEKRNQPSTIEC